MGWCLKLFEQTKSSVTDKGGVIAFCKESHIHVGKEEELGDGRICIGNKQGVKVLMVE